MFYQELICYAILGYKSYFKNTLFSINIQLYSSRATYPPPPTFGGVGGGGGGQVGVWKRCKYFL